MGPLCPLATCASPDNYLVWLSHGRCPIEGLMHGWHRWDARLCREACYEQLVNRFLWWPVHQQVFWCHDVVQPYWWWYGSLSWRHQQLWRLHKHVQHTNWLDEHDMGYNVDWDQTQNHVLPTVGRAFGCTSYYLLHCPSWNGQPKCIYLHRVIEQCEHILCPLCSSCQESAVRFVPMTCPCDDPSACEMLSYPWHPNGPRHTPVMSSV